MLFVPFALMVFRRLPRSSATAVVFLAGIGFLPEQAQFDLPVLPPLDKEYITYLSTLLGAWLYQRRSLTAARAGRGLEALVILMLIENIATALINPNAMMDEGKLEPGLGIWDVVARTGDDILGLGLPFFVGRAMFTTKEDLRVLMRALGIAALIYTVLIVIEIAGSIPFRIFQLGERVYGITVQPLWRWGVIQPVVFMDNGLSVAAYVGAGLVAIAGLLKARLNVLPISNQRARLVAAFGLLMTRNVAGNVYGLSLTVGIALFRPRVIATVALALVAFSCAYPALRTADLFPNQKLVDFANGYDRDRARSLKGRFDEEDFVLKQLHERFWLGWGNYARTPGAETFGEGEVGIDGWWVNRIGTHGILGVELQYAFLAFPVLIAWRRSRNLRNPSFMPLLAALMAIVGVRSVDLLQNGWWNSLPIFYAGALSGVTGGLGRSSAPPRRDSPVQRSERNARANEQASPPDPMK